MRQLGEQWIEEIDGKRHMVKAVKQTNKCSGCIFCTSYWCGNPIQNEREFDCSTMIIKDLGILNDDGLLPCPFCGEYPVVENAYEGFGYTPPDGYWRVYHCSNDNHEISISSGKRRQESIDAWNRRT